MINDRVQECIHLLFRKFQDLLFEHLNKYIICFTPRSSNAICECIIITKLLLSNETLILSHLDKYTTFPHFYFVSNDGFRLGFFLLLFFPPTSNSRSVSFSFVWFCFCRHLEIEHIHKKKKYWWKASRTSTRIINIWHLPTFKQIGLNET